jgi:hypothetical protein
MANITLGVILLGLYGRANIWNWQATAARYGEKIDLPYPQYNEEDCILDYPLTRDATCIRESFVVQLGNAQPEQIYQLAAYRLTIFATQTPANILPPDYQTEDPLILHSDSRWLNVYMRDWLLDGAPQTLMYHLAPAEAPADANGRPLPQTSDLPDPLAQVSAPEDWQALLAGLEGDSLWYLFTPEVEAQAAAIEAYLSERGYVSLYIPIRQAPYERGAFRLMRYRRAPAATETRFRFGEGLSLQAWDLPKGARPCEALQITTWWQLDGPSPNLSLSLRLVDTNGEKVSNTDGAPAGIDLGVWEPGRLYADDRALAIPCDLPPGDYQAVLGFYQPEDFRPIPAYDAEGEALGDYAPLGIIRVDN